MTWFKVDDKSAFHEKVVAAGDAAWGLLCRAGAWSSGQGTDGRIPPHVAKLLCPSKARWDALVSVRLMERTDDGGFVIHDFLQWNPSASQVEAKRSARAAAGQRGGVRSGQSRSNGSTDERSKTEAIASYKSEPPSRPVPTRPDPKVEMVTSGAPEVPVPVESPPPAEPPVTPPPKSAKPKPAPHPRFREVVDAYAVAFESARGSKPVINGAEGTAVNRLLTVMKGDADKAIATIRAAYADPFKARNATIRTIASDPSKYLGSAAAPTNRRPVQPIGQRPQKTLEDHYRDNPETGEECPF